jgi:hypothetical protein
MKKTKLLVAAVTASVLALGGGALAGCNKHSHEYSQDWQKDGTGHWWMPEYLQPNISL